MLGTSRARYPLHAVLMVCGSALLLVFNLLAGFLFMALVPPLIPVYISILVAGACLVRSALSYAARVSVPRAAAMLPARHEQEARPKPLARAARA